MVAHDGVFLEDFEKITESKESLKKKYLQLDKDKFVVLYSGSLQKGKGFELILGAAKKILDVYFVIIGNNNSNNEVKLDNLIFVGQREQQKIPYYLKSADLLLLPNTKALFYWQFTSPLKLFEYMASGVPILTSNLGSIGEILNENNSFLFSSDDLTELVKKVQYIRDNKGEAGLKSIKASEDVRKYAWPERVKNILDFIECG